MPARRASSRRRPNDTRSPRGAEPWARGPLLLAILLVAPAFVGSALPTGCALPVSLVVGCQEWVARYNGPGGTVDHATAVAFSPDGTVAYVGGKSRGTGMDYVVVALDAASGAQLWTQRVDGAGNGDDLLYDLAVSGDGSRLLATGESLGAGTAYDILTVAFATATGTVSWIARYDATGGDDLGRSVAVAGPRVLVAGTSDADFVTLALDLATGTLAWSARYDGPVGGVERVGAPAVRSVGDADFAQGRSLVVSLDGATAFVTGASAGSGTGNDYATVAYDAATGARKWVARFHAGSIDEPRGLAVTPDGLRLVVTGSAWRLGSRDDYATVFYNAATGAEMARAFYNGPAGTISDRAFDVAVSPDGTKAFVTGWSYGVDGQSITQSWNYGTVAYETASGSLLWSAHHDEGIDFATNVEASADGLRVYVTGASSGRDGQAIENGAPNEFRELVSDYLTVAYEASTGAPLWTGRYNAQASPNCTATGAPRCGNDYPRELGVAAGGRVVVVGESHGGLGFGKDFAAVAYAP